MGRLLAYPLFVLIAAPLMGWGIVAAIALLLAALAR